MLEYKNFLFIHLDYHAFWRENGIAFKVAFLDDEYMNGTSYYGHYN